MAIFHAAGMQPNWMEEVKNLAKWWNSEVVVPSLSTSLCIVSGPGALPLLRNLTNLMRVWASTSATSSCSFQRQNGSHLGPQENKNTCDYPR